MPKCSQQQFSEEYSSAPVRLASVNLKEMVQTEDRPAENYTKIKEYCRLGKKHTRAELDAARDMILRHLLPLFLQRSVQRALLVTRL